MRGKVSQVNFFSTLACVRGRSGTKLGATSVVDYRLGVLIKFEIYQQVPTTSHCGLRSGYGF
jgi:hypothetical protein